MAGEDSEKLLDVPTLLEALQHPLRSRVLMAVAERPGVTVNQISDRLGESSRRVRHQLDWLVAAGLVVVDGATQRRNARERHYRVVVKTVRVDDWADLPSTSEERRRVSLGVVRLLIEDVRRAIDAKTFGTHKCHSEARIPGEIDDVGWEELDRIVSSATKEVEETMRRAARRLVEDGGEGTEVVFGLLLFEAEPWRLDGERGVQSARSIWLDE